MAKSTIFLLCLRLSSLIKAIFVGIYAFLLFYIPFLFCIIPIVILLLYRRVLSLIFKIFYKSRYELISYTDACFFTDTYASLFNITFFVYIKGFCDIHQIRQRLSTKLQAKDKDGRRPYGILLNAAVEKFGFPCWEDKSSSVDFTHHVRLCPNANDLSRVYTESDTFDTFAQQANDMWDQDKPRWEVLVVPQVKSDKDICSLLCVKLHHLYVDGISAMQLLRHLADEPLPKLVVDPVNPPMSHDMIPIHKKILLYIQTFFLGPYVSYQMAAGQKAIHNDIFNEGPLTGSKMFGKTQINISMDMMRDIRKRHGCSTQAVFHSAFNGALHKMCVRNGLTIPNEIIGGITHVRFPYPDEYPNNRSALFPYDHIKIGITDPIQRLEAMNGALKSVLGRQYGLLWNYITLKVVGIFPAKMISAAMRSLSCTYVLSNVPGIIDGVKVDGKDVELILGTPPVLGGMRYAAGIGFYNGNFTVGFQIEKSKIIPDSTNLKEFIQAFENEILYLQSFKYKKVNV